MENILKKIVRICLEIIRLCFTLLRLLKSLLDCRSLEQLRLLTFAIFQVFQSFRTKLDGISLGLGRQPSVLDLSEREAQENVHELHALLPVSELYSYSILIPVYQAKPFFFKTAILSALSQSAPKMEVLIGFDEKPDGSLIQLLKAIEKEFPEKFKKIRVFTFERSETSPGGISNTTNALAQEARGQFLLLLDHDDWIRSDLLYRYEQYLRLVEKAEQCVLFCNEFKINAHNHSLFESVTQKQGRPRFPFLFINTVCHALLVPKQLWKKLGGLRPVCDGAQDYDLILRLNLLEADFQLIPFPLYAWRSHNKSTAKNPSIKASASEAGVRAFSDYVKMKKLSWLVEEGLVPTSYRALPPKRLEKEVPAFIFLKHPNDDPWPAIEGLKAQESVELRITVLCPEGTPHSLLKALKEKGVHTLRQELGQAWIESEVLSSTLKSLADKTSCDCFLLLHPLLTLDKKAVQEMLTWVNQPRVGFVGGTQFIGKISQDKPRENLYLLDAAYFLEAAPHATRSLEHSIFRPSPEVGKRGSELGQALCLSCPDALSRSMLLIRKSLYFELGGFDLSLYPEQGFDFDLALRARRQDYYCLYTPFAFGTFSATLRPRERNKIQMQAQIHPELSRWVFFLKQRVFKGSKS